jgi:uncharacterized protein (TIGR02147 family)
MQMPLYKQVLHQELARRSEKNPQYSLRAFSKSLGVDIGVVSRVFANKRTLSFPIAERMVSALGLTLEEKRFFLDSVAEEQRNRMLSTPLSNEKVNFSEIESELFHIIGDWYHYAILELTSTSGFQNDPRWIAKQFGLNVYEVRLALAKLIKVGLLKEVEGKLVRGSNKITTKNKEMTNQALKKHQKQMLRKAFDAIDQHPIAQRSMTGMTMAIDPAKLSIAKGMIDEFSKKMSTFLESGKKKKVYQLQLSLFPLQVDTGA